MTWRPRAETLLFGEAVPCATGDQKHVWLAGYSIMLVMLAKTSEAGSDPKVRKAAENREKVIFFP